MGYFLRRFQHRKTVAWCTDCDWENYSYTKEAIKDRAGEIAADHMRRHGHRVFFKKEVLVVYVDELTSTYQDATMNVCNNKPSQPGGTS